LHQAQVLHRNTGKAARVFAEFHYQTRESWSCSRRVVAKTEYLPHRIHDAPRFDARFATQQTEHSRTLRRCRHPAKATRTLQQETGVRLHVAACFARVNDTYPASPKQSTAAGKTPPAPIHSLQTPQPMFQPRPDYAASATLQLRS
jgi:hypothetical protein